MIYYYIIYSLLFLYLFLLNNQGKIDIKMFLGVGHSDKKVFMVELGSRLCFLALIISLIFEFIINGLEFNIIATFFQIISLILFYISKKTMKDSWATNIINSPKLITTGIFRYSRNPVYVSYFLLFLSMIFVNYKIFSFIILIFLICFHLLVKQEEKFLINEFGSEYEEYMKNVRRYI